MTEYAANQTEAAAVPEGWRGILRNGERILWQGRPEGGWSIAPRRLFPAVFGLIFAGFAMFWMAMAAQAGGGFWMFGLIHFSVGVGITGHALFWDTLRRRRTWYTLTDQRAFIATDLPFRGRVLDSYPIAPQMRLSLREGKPGSVIFAREERRGSKGARYTVEIGFERIAEAAEIHGLMRDLQRQAEADG